MLTNEPVKRHELKTWPECFEAIVSGRKPFEVRENDRDFQVGEELLLREYVVGRGYTGREACVRISYITDWKQQPRYVVLGFRRHPAWLSDDAGERGRFTS